MKKQFYFLFILFLTLFSFQSKASHLVGSDISYQCTSTPGVYKVTMKIYRDCAGIPLCPGCTNPIPNGTVSGCTTGSSGWSTQIIGASSSCTGTNYGAFTLSALSVTSGFDIIQTCTSVYTICTNCNTRNAGTFSPGIEIYTYEGNVDLSSLPTNCCRVTLGANTCCRNGALTTIVPGSFQTVCEIDRCQIPCNSSPTFTNDASALVCAGVDFVYNLGAMDPDGDSLSYAFGQSLQGIGTAVQYVSPYSAGYPFPYFGAPNANATYPAGLRIDPLTGDISFRPTGVFVSNLVIEVTQWKLVGSVRVNVGMTRRDVQFQTQLCLANKIPIIKVYKNNVLQSGTSGFTTMAGTQLCLDIVAEDQSQVSPVIVADTTDLRWNYPGLYHPIMANATFIRNYISNQRGINGPKADSFKFCWTPPIGAVRQEPYLFSVTGKDRFCPIPAFATRGITILVQAPKTILIDSTTKNIFCNNRITTTNVNYTASKINLLSGNVFTVQLSDSLGSFTNATIIGTKTANDSIGFIPITIPSGLPLNKSYKIRVNCSSDTVNLGIAYSINFVAGFNTPIITNNKDSFCQGLVSTFKVTPKTAGLTFKWLKNNVVITNQTKDSLLVDSAFTYRAIVSNTGCSDTSNAKYLNVFQKPIANFTALNTICLRGTSTAINLTNTSTINTGSMTYNWLFSDNTNSNLLNPIKTVTDTGSLVVKLITTSNNNCIDSVTKTLAIKKGAIADFIVNNSSQCLNGNSFVFTNLSTNSNSQNWNFGDAGSSTNVSPTKTYINAGIFTVKLLAKNAANCNDSITKTISVNVKATANFTINNSVQCLNGNSFIFTNSSANSNNQNWSFGDTSISNVLSPTKTYANSGSFIVKLVAKNTANCNDSITKNITINMQAAAGFTINNASQCLNENSFVFTNSSTGSNSQTWNFGDANNSTSLSPTKTYTNAGSFTVKLVAKNTANCNDSTTKTINVNAQAAADFTINNASQCLNGNNFGFTNLSASSNGQTWDFGDISNSTVLSPTKTYTNTGIFIVKLVAKNAANCNDSIYKTVTVKASPVIGSITGTTSPSSLSTPFNYIVLNQANTVYDWTVNNGTIQSGQGTNVINVLWSSVGTGKVNAKITNVNSCADSNNLTVNISSVGINNLSLDNDLKVYPNPTKTSITITNKTNLVGKKYIITNLVGQTVLSGKLNLDETLVNLENLQSGVYLLSIDGMNKQSIKVIKE